MIFPITQGHDDAENDESDVLNARESDQHFLKYFDNWSLQTVPGAGEGKEEPGLTREEQQVRFSFKIIESR